VEKISPAKIHSIFSLPFLAYQYEKYSGIQLVAKLVLSFRYGLQIASCGSFTLGSIQIQKFTFKTM
jgi:hypothetical protein